MVQNTFLHDLAWGPKRYVNTWPVYFVNGYKFHIDERTMGKKTINSGVCVKGVGQDANESDYYGILKEVVEIEYPGEPKKKVVLFYCDWFDPLLNRGVKIHKQYKIIEVRHTRRYAKYDPFIFAKQATQVYYVPYPKTMRDKIDWWVVMKINPRSNVDNRYTLEVAYQDADMPSVNDILDDICVDNLVDNEGAIEEVGDYNDENLDGDDDQKEKDYEESSFSEDDNDLESQDESDFNEDN